MNFYDLQNYIKNIYVLHSLRLNLKDSSLATSHLHHEVPLIYFWFYLLMSFKMFSILLY